MTGPLKRSAQTTKKAGCPIGAHKCRSGPQKSPVAAVFQRSRDRLKLPHTKLAAALAAYADQRSVPNMQKVLAGTRGHSLDLLEEFLFTELGWDLLEEMHARRVAAGRAPTRWFTERGKAFDLRAERVAVMKLQRELEARDKALLERELAQ